MFDHVSVGVDDVAKARILYDGAMAALGMKPVFELGEFAVAYGTDVPSFWVQKPENQKAATAGNGTHVCFRAESHAAVQAFYEAALKGGAIDAGAPGPRPEYTPTYYAAFFRDDSGNKIEAVCYAEN
jgi:catechol 2,3-dioxygenase-like lactoylglutathione lyase family enzyme